MSKQRKPPELREARAPEHVQAGVGSTPDVGNAAMRDQLADRPAGIDVVREVAFPMVERAMLALQLVPRGHDQIDRYVGILERSHLPEDRRNELADRLRTDEAVAQGVKEAVERWFDADSDELRGGLTDVLDQVWHGLMDGTGDDGASTWRVADREIGLSTGSLEGSVAARAESLVSDLSKALGGAAADRVGGARIGESVRGFCRDVQLALIWDEEEEEQAEWGEASPGEGG